MTLHEAIIHVLNNHSGGLSLNQIADKINEQQLYVKRDRTVVTPDQIKIRIHNYQHLFYAENGVIHSQANFEKTSYFFEHIIHDIIVSTTNASITDRQIAIPLLVFIKRIVEAEMNTYEIKVDVHFREYYEEFEEDVPTTSLKDYQSGLVTAIDELFEISYKLETIRPFVLNFIRDCNPEILRNIHTVLLRYSFAQDKYSNKEFGYLFNSLIERLSKATGNYLSFTTPEAVNKIITNLYTDDGFSLLDPFAGAGGTLISRNNKHASRIIVGYEKSRELWIVGNFNLILNGVDTIDFYNTDVLTVSGLFKKKAELIITDIPFDSKLAKSNYDFLHWADTTDATSVYLQYILDSLEKEGKAVVVVPAAFLFSSNQSVRKLKDALLESNLLDAVVSLPAGLLKPYTGVACAILCFDLGRSFQQDVLFIDAAEVSKASGKEKDIDDDDIDLIIRLFNERPKSFELNKLIAGTFSAEQIRDEGFDWTPKRHLYQLSNKKQIDLFGDSLSKEVIELGEVLRKTSTVFLYEEVQKLKIIKGRDLKPGIIDYTLYANQVSETALINAGNATVIAKNVLMIQTHFKSLKPTYFAYTGEAVLIANSIKAYEIDETMILPEYLIAQLHAPYFLEQLDAIRTGSSQSFFSVKDFLRLRIKLPVISKQKELYDEARNNAFTAKAEEADELTQELVRQRTTAVSEQIAIISSIQHELGNKLPALKNSMDDLKDFIRYKSGQDDSFSFSTKIRPVLPGEQMEDVDSVEDVFKRIENILTYTISMVDDAGGIINSDPSRYKPQKTELVNYLKQEVDMYKQVHNLSANIHFEFPEEDGPIIWLDKKQCSKALSNMISNAIKHGFTEPSKNYHIVFQIIPDDQHHVLVIKNDGLPFPEGFTIEQYKQPYQYAGKNGTSGVGGYIISKVLENHKAEIILRDQIDIADPFKVQFEIRFPK